MDIFISYRRETSSDFCVRLTEALKSKHYNSFLDRENMHSGEFDKQLYRQIEKCPNFVLVLPNNALDRCVDADDWLRLEIAHALKLKKNIILIFFPGFDFPKTLPDNIRDIKKYQGIQYNNENFTQLVDKLISYLRDDKNQPLLKNKKENNDFYSAVGISKKEAKRMKDEMEISSILEKPFLEEALKGRSNLVGFSSTIYGLEKTHEYLSHPAFEKVFVALASEEQKEEAKKLFVCDSNHKLYDPAYKTEAINELLCHIEKENNISGFDFIYSNLFLMDAENPLATLRVFRDHLNDKGILFIRESDDGLVTASPDNRGDFEKAISIISDDKYAGNRRFGREIFTLLRLVGAKEIHHCPTLLTTVNMSQKDKEKLFNALFGYQIEDFNNLLERDPENLIYQNDLQWYKDHLESMEKDFLRDDFFFVNGFIYYYAIFEKDN